MAGRPKKVTEVSKEVQDVNLTDAIEEETIEEVVQIEEILAENPVELVIEPVKETLPLVVEKEEAFNPKDIVEFYNNKGDLKYAPFAYIEKRGYKALRKYTKKK